MEIALIGSVVVLGILFVVQTLVHERERRELIAVIVTEKAPAYSHFKRVSEVAKERRSFDLDAQDVDDDGDFPDA